MHFKTLHQLPGLTAKEGKVISFLNKLSLKLGLRYNLLRVPDGINSMHTVEQRMNFMLLAQQVIHGGVEGEWIEAGCYDGQSAMVFQKVFQNYYPGRAVRLYDNFQRTYGKDGGIQDALLRNFAAHQLNPPTVIKGNFSDTMPGQLPEQIAFAHIDCGYGGDPAEHAALITFLLENIYPRLTPGAVLTLMDYHDPEHTVEGNAVNPGVKPATDAFFSDKPEEISTLYGHAYSHACIVKGSHLRKGIPGFVR